MENFYIYSSLEVKVYYIISVICLFLYFILKYKKRQYFISIFNYGLFFYFFSIYITLFFQYENKAWYKLGEINFKKFILNLNKSAEINLIGFSIFFIFLTIFELKKRNKYLKKIRKIRILNFINYMYIKLLNYIYILLSLYLFIFKFKTIPLLGNRMIATKLGAQTSYNIINGGLVLITVILILNNKNLKLIYLNLLLLICSGNRGPVIMILAYLGIIKIYSKKELKSKQKMFILLFTFLFGMGIILEIIRGSSLDKFTEKILYGNTFSDIRDGAYILYNIDKKINSFLFGKTYLADIISFIPAEYSKFRTKWGYSLFTTLTLLKWKNHFGLRGGPFLAPYFNFGYFGIAIFAYIFAYLYSMFEHFFYEIYIKKLYNCNYGIGACIYILLLFSNSLMIPASFIQFYVSVINFILLIIIGYFFKKYKKEIK